MISRRVAQLGRRVFPAGLWEGPPDRPWVALTVDDGPHPEITPRLLQVLRRCSAPAAFFLVGSRAEQQPDLVRRIAAQGHAVGNHTWSHRPLMLGCSRPSGELERTEELLARLAPGSPRVFRPPFGAIGPGGPAALARAGLLPVYWSVVPADWDPLPASEVSRRVLQQVHPGAIVVLHGGRPWHAGTVEALEGLIDSLRERGYELVTLSRMLAAAGLAVGCRG